MAQPGTPLFLARDGYRQRRVMDAVRLLVILGAGLWLLPLLWPSVGATEAEAVPTSKALLYVFGVWCVVIAVSGVLARGIRRKPPQPDDSGAV